jgi:hypothetical protein
MPVVIANAAMLAITYNIHNIVSMYVIYNIVDINAPSHGTA